MKRAISVMLAVLLVFGCVCTAFAAETRASRVIDTTTVGISYSGGKVYGLGNITTVATAKKLGMSAMALYEKDGTSWKKIASASGKYGYNDNNYSYTISATATTGKEYKMVAPSTERLVN